MRYRGVSHSSIDSLLRAVWHESDRGTRNVVVGGMVVAIGLFGLLWWASGPTTAVVGLVIVAAVAFVCWALTVAFEDEETRT